jgi:hypothetical protein
MKAVLLAGFYGKTQGDGGWINGGFFVLPEYYSKFGSINKHI